LEKKENIMSAEMKVNRPEPIQSDSKTIFFKRGTDLKETVDALIEGKYVLIGEYYSNGLDLLHALDKTVRKLYPSHTFQEQRKYRSEFRKLSQLILLRVKDNRLVVNKSPKIGWFEKLYSDMDEFLLPFPQVQGLNSAWQWYQNGITIPVLRNKVHPYYGTYFPTRFEHLQLFDNWLKRYEGPKKSAIDVGIGSGVLSLMIMKHGFQKSFGTDTNSNAIIGLTESMEGTKLARKVELDFASLFGKWDKETELIVFNPPWLPASHEMGRLDEAIYYNENLFPEFFEGAKKRILPDGKVVLLFSNLAQITEVTKVHPIEKELAEGGRFKLELCLKKGVKAASDKTKRNQHWREDEEVELWVLSPVG